MTTYLGKSCSFCLPRVPFVNCRQFMYLVISLLVLRAGYGIWLYQFLIIAFFIFTLDHNELPCAKTLGVWWLAQEDVFTFKENVLNGNTVFTKSNFLKKIATLFDPLGLLAPYTVRAKMLLQEMWTAGLEWDDELPEPLIHAACAWFGELSD